MEKLFADVPEALRATVEIARRWQRRAQARELRFPRVEGPGGSRARKPTCAASPGDGLAVRLGPAADAARRGRYEERLAYELGVIEQMDFPSYFLAVWDFVHFAKTAGIPVGPAAARRPGASRPGRLASRTSTRSVYGLLFERFLNPGRKSMPTSTSTSSRFAETSLAYVRQKYGEDRVAQIITFARCSQGSSGRRAVLGMPLAEVDKIAKLVPPELKITIEKALKDEAAPRRDGREGHAGRPPARDSAVARGAQPPRVDPRSGVLISPEPLSNLVPLCRAPTARR